MYPLVLRVGREECYLNDLLLIHDLNPKFSSDGELRERKCYERDGLEVERESSSNPKCMCLYHIYIHKSYTSLRVPKPTAWGLSKNLSDPVQYRVGAPMGLTLFTTQMVFLLM